MAVSVIKDSEPSQWRKLAKDVAPAPTVKLRGANVRAWHGASFARAFVAGLRQAGDTAPLVQTND